jgi:hypothetical protein
MNNNPTVGSTQFNAPFDIQPNPQLPNPSAQNNVQFTAPFDITPNTIYTNPTTGQTQFVTNFNPPGFSTPLLQDNPTSNAAFVPNFDSPIGATATIVDNPTLTQPQFVTNFNPPGFSTPNPISNPTYGSFQFKSNWMSENFEVFNNDTTQAPGQFDTTKPLDQFAQVFKNDTKQSPDQFINGFSTAVQPVSEYSVLRYRSGSIQRGGAVFNNYTNVIPTFGSVLKSALGFGAASAVALTGIPQIGQSANQLIEPISNPNESKYSTLPYQHLSSNIPGTRIPYPAKYLDFRSRLAYSTIGVPDNLNGLQDTLQGLSNLRLDGASAATRGSGKAALYAAAAASPLGAYSVFNLDGAGKSGFGWGDHDSKYAIRADFTLRSEVATTWTPDLTAAPIQPIPGEDGQVKYYPGQFQATRKPQEIVIPFRGDKVTVIDFGKRRLDKAYQWRPNKFKKGELNNILKDRLDTTQDFIKFYFTGPNLDPSQISNPLIEDDVIVFRAILTGLDDSFAGNWSEINMIGRADPNYQYTGYSRNLSVNFDVVATDRDELKSIYRKLNALAGYTAPTYDPASIAMKAPWMRLTIGDLFLQTPVVMTTLGYTYATDHSWEINIEEDPEMFQVPHKVGVSCQFNIISNYLPQQQGRFFGLAKQFDKDGAPIQGNDNWLSDFKNNVPPPPSVDPVEDTITLPAGETTQNLDQERNINNQLEQDFFG